ncbi:hypothetical protein HGRIS_014971 [Hohenbuehelia grisea]|uniref:HAT C-terminal dimerisation domain-containing protein n=1 Tax=Hohenbuehelia grisea TaxID=104357 RepID=A0ABR3IP41_9AGAR
MSATRHPMLSSCLAIFRGLQDHLKNILRSLPDNIPPILRDAVTAAHQKLSDYYNKFDESPYCMWASLLDPRISYEALKSDYTDDPILSEYLESSRAKLEQHFNKFYKTNNSTPTSEASSTSSAPAVNTGHPQRISFVARYKRVQQATSDELEEFWRLAPEDYESCDPIAWWYGRKSQFPNLYRLAFDILAIPGSAVAVEQIFSGGR